MIDLRLADSLAALVATGAVDDARARLAAAAGVTPSLAPPLGWAGPIAALESSPRGDHLAVVHGDLVSVLDPETGRERLRLAGHAGAVRAAAFDPSGARLVSAGADGTLRAWDLATGAACGEPVAMDGEGTPLCVFATSGELITLDASTLRFRDPDTFEARRSHDVEYMTAGAVSFDGERWAQPVFWDTVEVTDVRTGAAVITLARSKARAQVACDAIVFSRDGRFVAAGSRCGDAWLWDVTHAEPVRAWAAHDDVIGGVAFSDDGAWLATVSQDHTAKIWDTRTGALIHTLAGHSFTVEDIEFQPGGSHIFTIGREGTELCKWSLDGAAPAPVAWARAPADEIYSLAISSHGDLAGGSVDQTLIRRADGTMARFGAYRWATYGAAFSGDGARLAAGGADRVLRVWDVASGAELAAIDRRAFPEVAPGGDYDGQEETPSIHSVAWSGGELVASYEDGVIVRWRLDPPAVAARTDREVACVLGGGAHAIVVHEPKGDDVEGGVAVELVELATGAVVAVLRGLPTAPRSFALRGDGAQLATTEYPRVLRLWELPSGRPLGTATVPAGERMFDPHLPVAFGPDGTLWCGDNTGSVHELDPVTLAPRRTVQLDREAAFALVTEGGVTSLAGDAALARRHVVGAVGAVCLPGALVA